MLRELQKGTSLNTRYGKRISVLDRIGEGGQGAVYSVLYDGQPKALKWYRPDVFVDRARFMDNLSRNIRAGKPTDEFLWPIDMTDLIDGSFGYVMDLRPNGYVDADTLFMHPELFPSFRRTIDACLNIVSDFRILHDKGYCYQDVNGGNFFINPQTGKVLICDNDNVAPTGTDTGIRGTPRFMAPEIVCENAIPSQQSDRHSMSVLIFFLLLVQHPLEGIRMTRNPVLDGDTQMRLYGTDPLFILDKENRSNAPDPIHPNVLKVWPTLPEHMRSFFERAFSQQALKEPSRRPTEYEWTRELVRLRSEVVTCTCGNEVFMQDARTVTCDNPDCGRAVHALLRADLADYSLPAVNDTRIYRCQTCVCNADQVLDPMAWVLASRGNPNMLGVRNISRDAWSTTNAEGEHDVAPGAVLRLEEGMTLNINGEHIHIVNNDR